MKPLTTLGETPAALDEAPLSGSTADSHIFLKAKFLLCAGSASSCSSARSAVMASTRR